MPRWPWPSSAAARVRRPPSPLSRTSNYWLPKTSTPYRQIKCFAEDVADGSEDGSLDFLVLGGGAVGSDLQSGLKIEGDTASTVKLGFFGVTPVTQPAITGSKSGVVALASLIDELVNLGLITDSTT